MYCAFRDQEVRPGSLPRSPERTARSMVAMRISQTMVAGVVAATTLAVSVAGCGSKTSSTTPSGSGTRASATSAAAQARLPPRRHSHNDYTGLLIQAGDIKAPETFTASPPINNPNGQPGVATTFSTTDSNHVIHDTIQVLADPAAATNALNAAKTGQGHSKIRKQSRSKTSAPAGRLSRATHRTATKGWPLVVHRGQGICHAAIRWPARHASAAGLPHRRRPKTRRGRQEGARRLT